MGHDGSFYLVWLAGWSGLYVWLAGPSYPPLQVARQLSLTDPAERRHRPEQISSTSRSYEQTALLASRIRKEGFLADIGWGVPYSK